MATVTKLLFGYEDVASYLDSRPALQYGGITPEAAILLGNNTSRGRCAVAFHVQIDGKDQLVKISLDMLQMIGEVMRAAAVQQYGEKRSL